jgi:hypothetical protein
LSKIVKILFLNLSGPAAILPEHAPRDEAAKLEESRGEIQVSEIVEIKSFGFNIKI